MTDQLDSSATLLVLVADTPLFEAGYASSLLERGMRAVSPIVDGDQAVAAGDRRSELRG